MVSFKDDPVAVASGADDAYLSSLVRHRPADRVTWWTYFHEPENDVEAGAFTAAQFRAAFRHVAALAQAPATPTLHATLILMGWTAVTPTRNFADYYPGTTSWTCSAGTRTTARPALGKAYSRSGPGVRQGRRAVADASASRGPSPRPERRCIPGDSGAARAAYLARPRRTCGTTARCS